MATTAITLVIATRNAHKVGEIRAILGDAFRFLTLCDFPAAPAIVEDADTFAGNARKKAVALAEWLLETRSAERGTRNDAMSVLADDSGLEVDALDGAPGVCSARFAALDSGDPGNSSDAANNAKLLRLLQNVPIEKRSARFRCVLALAAVESLESRVAGKIPHPAFRIPRFFEGVCEGRIAVAPRGQGGFGYDPLFVPAGFEQTFAELGEMTKNQLSHRSRALAQLRAWLAAPA